MYKAIKRSKAQEIFRTLKQSGTVVEKKFFVEVQLPGRVTIGFKKTSKDEDSVHVFTRIGVSRYMPKGNDMILQTPLATELWKRLKGLGASLQDKNTLNYSGVLITFTKGKLRDVLVSTAV